MRASTRAGGAIHRRGHAALLALTTAVLLGVGSGTAAAVPPPPPNPSDQQLTDAAAAQAGQAAEVGRLAALVAQSESQIEALQAQAEIAAEEYHQAQEDLTTATATAVETQAAATAAAQAVTDAQTALSSFSRSSYIQGSTMDSGLYLLSSDGPAQLIERAGLLESVSASHVDVLGNLQTAKVAQANADSAARQAVLDKQAAETVAEGSLQASIDKVDAGQVQLDALSGQKAGYEAQLEQAQITLLGLQGARDAYDVWAQQKAAEDAENARRAEVAAQAARAAAAAAAAAEAAKPAPVARTSSGSSSGSSSGGSSSGGSSSGGSSSGGSSSGGSSSSGSGWTAAKGQAAVAAAVDYVGTPYAWGGGGIGGPSEGFGVDEGVIGFDCSGLSQYAWSEQGIILPRTSGSQFSYGGDAVSRDHLLPGDLVFWNDGGPIHHVAIWMGNDMIVQAPHSGSYVQISSMWWSGYAGAVRPGT